MGNEELRGFTFLPSYYTALQGLSSEDKLKMYEAIIEYGVMGKEPELDPKLMCAFEFVRPNIDASVRRYNANVENGKKGGRPIKNKPSNNPTETQQNPTETQQNPTENPEKPKQNHEKEKEKEKERERDNVHGADAPARTRTIFQPPPLEEVKAYCTEHGIDAEEAEAFYDYFVSVGWVTGNGKKIKDWRAALRVWHRREGNFTGKKPLAPEEPAQSWRHGKDGSIVFKRNGGE